MTYPSIFFCGDLHGNFGLLINAVKTHLPRAIILLGDIQAEKPLNEELADVLDMTDIWFIPGNHDTDSDRYFDNIYQSRLAHKNLHGRVVEIEGVRIAGLGGVFRGQVWCPPQAPRFASPAQFIAECGKGNLWRSGLPRKHYSTIFCSDVEGLRHECADVLVTHEAPHCNMFGSQAITDLGIEMGVKHMFHGHHHEQRSYTDLPALHDIKAYSVGLCCITDLSGSTIVGA